MSIASVFLRMYDLGLIIDNKNKTMLMMMMLMMLMMMMMMMMMMLIVTLQILPPTSW